METDDNEKAALRSQRDQELAELEAAWRLYQKRGDEDKEIANALCERVDSGHAFNFAVVYLAAKREYQKPNSRTTETFERWQGDTFPYADFSAIDDLRTAWNAALANAQTGGRFQVGDEAEANYRDGLHGGLIGFVPTNPDLETIFDPFVVRPAPKTVDLTDDEKLGKVAHEITDGWVGLARALATGKTLDQLCEEFGIETTRRV